MALSSLKSAPLIAMVAGEASGDVLGAGLIQQLKLRYPDARFEGIGGPLMMAEGLTSLAPMERLSVMGLIEVLGRLSELLKLRKRLAQHFTRTRPDVFIGIDAPDFNLGLEKKLRTAGIKTVQYVAPQVWAWRQHRVKSIARSADLILALFPFEADFYRQHQVAVRCVGHPLADQIPLVSDKESARQVLALDSEKPVLALLPGSRRSEVARLAETFLQTALRVQQALAGCQVVIAVANDSVREILEQKFSEIPAASSFKLIKGQTRQVMAAADILLAASGTVTLEAALVKRPMVVSYKLASLTFWLARRLVKVKSVALPNLLMPTPLIPEYIQDKATPEALAQALLRLYRSDEAEVQTAAFEQIHHLLRRDADRQAAEAISGLMEDTSGC